MPSHLFSLLPLTILFPGIYVALYIAALAHECGHALCGALCGYRITSLGMGTARPLFVVRLPGGTRFYVCRTAPLQGLTWAYQPRATPSKARTACFVMGGVAVNMILAALTLLPWHGFPQTPFNPVELTRLVFGFSNALLAVTNLFPFFLSVEGRDVLRSDGAQLLGFFLARGRQTAHSARAAMGFRPLWAAIGDTEMQTSQLLHAAGVAGALGDKDAAQRLLNDAFALTHAGGSVPYLRGMACLTAAYLAVLASDRNSAEKWLEEADQAFGQAGSAAGQAQVAFVRQEESARRAAATGDLTGALYLLDTLPTMPLWGAQSLTQTNSAALRVRLVAENEGDIAAALARFENARRRFRSDTTDLETFATVARGLEWRGDTAGAVAQGYEPAIAAAQAIYHALGDAPDEQRSFAERQAPLIGDAQAALRFLGRDHDADALINAFPDPAIAEREKADANEQAEAKRVVQVAANNRRIRAGLIITVLNAGGGLLAYAVGQAAPGLTRASRLVDAFLAALLVAAVIHVTLTVIIGGFLLLNRVLLPNRNDATVDGWVILLLAASAYLTFALMFVAVLAK